VAAAATAIPAIRAARTSSVTLLADAPRPPKRRPALIAISSRLPVALLLSIRILARRPRRAILTAFSVAVTVAGIVAILASDAYNQRSSSGLDNLKTDRLNEIIAIITVLLVLLAAVDIVFIAWATATDSRRSSALARALGATPTQVASALSIAQVLPAVPAAVIGVPAGLYLYRAIAQHLVVPSVGDLLGVLGVTLLTIAMLTAIPARIAARQSVAGILQAEAS
jgi:putative ABC transport system permease protein